MSFKVLPSIVLTSEREKGFERMWVACYVRVCARDSVSVGLERPRA